MNVQFVKTAAGSRLRNPYIQGLPVLPSLADADAAPVQVDIDNPHWFTAVQCGDLVLVTKDGTPIVAEEPEVAVPASPPASATAPAPAPAVKPAPAAAPAPSTPAPAADASSSSKNS